MVSEEIEINPALEAAGVRAVETDLGEFIVQLRGEKPSHLITPAVHLRREDVSALFEKEFGMPPTLDVPAMTAVAREQLRRVFFGAQVGLSGVNFGVAETGTLALVTNEGNGRLCTTLPRVHIALMGLERLVPTLADLEVMLRLLPRSATAQKLSAYVSLLSGPRRAGEPDGPEELHVILLDNGRSRTLGGELAESLLCIRCGACLNVCPVYRQIGGHAYGSTYGGPIGAVVSPALFGAEFGELADASTLCGACRDICPVRIDIPQMLLTVRGQPAQEKRAPAWLRLGMRAYRWFAAAPGRFRLAQALAAFGTRLLARGGYVRRLPWPLDAWTQRRDFPAFARETFRAKWKKTKHV
jgi:L-lactate dehydrogenase complex protein LldF